MKLEHYKVNAQCMLWFSGCILAPMRRRLIKFHHRLVKMADRYGLTVDEMYTIYVNHWCTMSQRDFWQLWINNGNSMNPNWRENCIKEVRE